MDQFQLFFRDRPAGPVRGSWEEAARDAFVSLLGSGRAGALTVAELAMVGVSGCERIERPQSVCEPVLLHQLANRCNVCLQRCGHEFS